MTPDLSLSAAGIVSPNRWQSLNGKAGSREARGMSAELVKRSGVSEQQLSRLENGLFQLRLEHLKPIANALSPEQILLWVAIRALLEISPKVNVYPQRRRDPTFGDVWLRGCDLFKNVRA